MQRNRIGTILFYLVMLYGVGLLISGLTLLVLEFVPYLVASSISLMPIYGYMRNKKEQKVFSFSYTGFLKSMFSSFTSSISRTIVLVFVIFQLKWAVLSVVIQGVLLSAIGFGIVGITWTIARAVLKNVKKKEIPSFFTVVKSAL